MSHFVKRMTHSQWKENTQTEYKRLNDTQGPGGSKDIIFRDWLKKPYLFSSGAHLSLSPPGCHGSSTGGTGSGGAGPHPTEARFPYRHSPHLTQTASQPPPTPTHTPSKTLAGNHTHAWSCQLPSLGPRWTQCTKDIFSGFRSYFHGRYQIMGTSCSNKTPKFPYDITITIIILLLFPRTRKGFYPGVVKLCGKKYTKIIH